MPFRFSRHLRLIPGLRLNLSTHGTSVSFGGRGHWITVGRHSVRVTVGVPGTGMSWSERLPTRTAAPGAFLRRETVPPAAPAHAGHRLAFVFLVLAIMTVVALATLAPR